MRHIILSSIYLLSIALGMSSCMHKNMVFTNAPLHHHDIPIFIQQPKSIHVFENIAPLLYDTFIAHVERVGYRVVDRPCDGYTVAFTIKSLEPAYKYVSPDIVLFNTTVQIIIVCTLLNYRQEVVTQKEFTGTKLISKPRNPIQQSDITHDAYMKLLQNLVPTIEHYLRPFLLKNFT